MTSKRAESAASGNSELGSNSKRAEPGLNQGMFPRPRASVPHNSCLAKFQNSYGQETPLCFPFPPFQIGDLFQLYSCSTIIHCIFEGQLTFQFIGLQSKRCHIWILNRLLSPDPGFAEFLPMVGKNFRVLSLLEGWVCVLCAEGKSKYICDELQIVVLLFSPIICCLSL